MRSSAIKLLILHMSPAIRFTVNACVLSLALSACSRDPRSTALPLDVADIPKIQAQLDKLPPQDSAKVLAYLGRSKGDVLPAQFADPDAPFTARTFGEAIQLQTEFEAKETVRLVQVDAMKADRENAYAPLRKALAIELVRREILTGDQAMGRVPQPGMALDNNKVLVTTYRLINRSGEHITHAAGSVTIRTKADPRSLMGIDSCYLDDIAISDGQSVEMRCGAANRTVTQASQDYVDMPQSELVILWEPKTVQLAGGKLLKYGGL
jgi:hypothetical protein